MTNLDRNIAHYQAWCQKLGITSTEDINRLIAEGDSNWLINISEIWHEQKISEISRRIYDHIGQKKVIFISGPSSSGKTSFATRLKLHLKVLGINAIAISLDDYFRNKDELLLDADGKPDFESLEAIDYQLFNEHVRRLAAGQEVGLPHYSFHQNVRIENARTLHLNEDEVIIVEGIHGLNEKITAGIPNDHNYKIYCTALTVLTLEGEKISSTDTRLIRRMIRDYYFRNSSYRYTLELWPDVESGAVKNIFPYTDSADIIFNSSLLYEFCVYRQHLHKIVPILPPDDADYETIERLRHIADSFSPIDDELTPPTSLVREFVGGSTLFGSGQ